MALTLLVDQGEDAATDRWAAEEERYEDLDALVAAVSEPAVVVLGPPGAGKSTLLRHLEIDHAIAALRGDDPADPVTFFIQLNQYKPEAAGATPPLPGAWLAARWSAAYPDLPPLGELLAEGRMVLLLDALNEMPAATERESRERVGWWKDWLVRLAREQPGNRVVFSCRTLDYSASLSTPALRVPQVQIEPLSDTQVREFLSLYSPLRGEDIWRAIEGTPQLETLRAPFFLALLVDQVEATGELSDDRAGLFTGFVRQALKREVERDNPLFALADLLASRDVRRIARWTWRDAYELPERGVLVPKLSRLAYGMQAASADGGQSQLRVAFDEALALVDHARDEDILTAGMAISVLDEDPAADEVLYRHQLLQEYFAARVLAASPRPERVAAPWRGAEIRPGLRELRETLPPGETLQALPQTGWEETTVLAVAMVAEPEPFLRSLMAHNLEVAGRAAMPPGVRSRLSADFLEELRARLVARSRDPASDLRHRIACGHVLGELGDPRLERRSGPQGAYLAAPTATVPSGLYPVGDDDVIEWSHLGSSGTTRAHIPRHPVRLSSYEIGRFPVTNAEYACFLVAGGYEDPRWWDTRDARRWQRGDAANEAAKANNRMWRGRFLADPELFARMEADARFPSAEALERWRTWLALDEAGFEAALASQWQAKRQTEPRFWRDARFNRPSQPVVGVSWYEARAYCAWLSDQTGRTVRLPSEVEWEAAARGAEGWRFPWGDAWNPLAANTVGTRLKRTTPVGVFVEGESPFGASDMAGNVVEWTASLFGGGDYDSEDPDFAYPYRAEDGREDPEAGETIRRVQRGSGWNDTRPLARAAFRVNNAPGYRQYNLGFRLLLP